MKTMERFWWIALWVMTATLAWVAIDARNRCIESLENDVKRLLKSPITVDHSEYAEMRALLVRAAEMMNK